MVGSGADGVQPEAALSDAELIERLRSRAADCRQQSMTARLTAVLELVESLLGRGYGRSQVLDILTEVGWRFTSDSFDSALRRVRKRRLDIGTCVGGAVQQTAAAASLSADVGLSLTQPPAQLDQAPPVAVVENGSGEKEQPGFTDVFLAQRRRPNGGPRWK
ncbi:hypothetical protein BLA34_12345 [Ralstonia solanacearum]|nr:hypothetical protein BLA34_12345 [Ralstonia solanacearum]